MNKKKIKETYKDMLLRVAGYKGTEQKGRTNCYVCKNCHNVDKYIYRDTGTTPMVLACTKCKKRGSFSAMMRDVSPAIRPNQEWFRPGLEQTLNMAKMPHLVDHVLNGGLLRRPYRPLRPVADG